MTAKTMDDIAREAGVSRSTVSRALDGRNFYKVKASTRDHIHRIIEEEGFYPNTAARNLARRRPNAIGVVFPYGMFFRNSFYITEITRGIMQSIEEHGFSLTIYASRQQLKDFCYERVFYSGIVGGLLLVCPGIIDDSTILEMRKKGICLVVTNSRIENVDITYIDADNVRGGYLACEHLIHLGHRRIAHILGHPDSRNAMDRLEGYKQALKDHRIQLNTSLVVPGYYTEEGGYEAMEKLLTLEEQSTAVFAANDNSAVGAMRAAHTHDIEIPRDMAIVGYDDNSIATYVEPALTTVGQPICEIGRVAAEVLIKTMTEEDYKVQKIKLPVKLIIRASSRHILQDAYDRHAERERSIPSHTKSGTLRPAGSGRQGQTR